MFWIKQINKVNVTGIYNVQKGLTLHYNIVTLRSKNLNNAFKAKLNLLN